MKKDAEILKALANALAGIANLPVQDEKKAMWRALNRLDMVRPMVLIDQLPWHEMDIDGELTLHCEDEFLRSVEQYIKRILYNSSKLAFHLYFFRLLRPFRPIFTNSIRKNINKQLKNASQ